MDLLCASKKKIKVKQSLYRPGQALRVPGDWGSQISRQSAHEGGRVVSLTHRPSLPPRKYSWYSFLLEAESTPETQCDRKDYVNEKFRWHHRESNPRPSRLVAQCLNLLRHRVWDWHVELFNLKPDERFYCIFSVWLCFLLFRRNSPLPPPPSGPGPHSFTRFLDHTQRRTTVGGTPLH